MKNNIVIVVFLFLFGLSYLSPRAQDTLQLMQYNLLHYGNYYGDCTPYTNNVNDKNGYLRTIMGYVQPDILCVNEMSGIGQYAQLFLDEVMNCSGSKYRKASSLNSGSYLVKYDVLQL